MPSALIYAYQVVSDEEWVMHGACTQDNFDPPSRNSSHSFYFARFDQPCVLGWVRLRAPSSVLAISSVKALASLASRQAISGWRTLVMARLPKARKQDLVLKPACRTGLQLPPCPTHSPMQADVRTAHRTVLGYQHAKLTVHQPPSRNPPAERCA